MGFGTGLRIVLEDDTQDILSSFLSATGGVPSTPSRCLAFGFIFAQVLVQRIWRKGNMCADFITNEGSFLMSKIVWQENFPHKFVNFTMRNIFRCKYEIL